MDRFWGQPGSWLSVERLWTIGESLLAVLLIMVLAAVAVRVSRHAVDRALRIQGDGGVPLGVRDERRAKTLNSLVRSILEYFIYFAAGVAVLDQIGVDTRSIVAAAGILGLAIGFGAQNLVRDLVTGFFILLEDQYAVGDYITTAGVSGVVESVGIRTTRIRDFGGQLHIVPNGKVEQVTNHMGPAMRVMFTVTIAHEEDLDRVIQVLEELFAELKDELPDLVDGPQVLGVQEVDGSGVQLLLWARAKPMTQWAMTRELRLRVKKRFDERGIKIPYPRRHIIMDKDSLEQEPQRIP